MKVVRLQNNGIKKARKAAGGMIPATGLAFKIGAIVCQGSKETCNYLISKVEWEKNLAGSRAKYQTKEELKENEPRKIGMVDRLRGRLKKL